MTAKAARALRDCIEQKQPEKPGTQADLARFLGVTAQSVSQWLSGTTRPEAKHMAAIEDLFGIPMRDWLEPPSVEEKAAG